jgi:hypothetical protein
LHRGLLGLNFGQRSTDIDDASDENQDRTRLTWQQRGAHKSLRANFGVLFLFESS